VSKGVKRAAAAVSTMSRRQIGRHARPTELATVLTIDPLTVELVEGTGLVLGEDILVLGSSFRRHDRDLGVKVGDTVAVARLAAGDYLVHDVQTPDEVMKGIGTTALAGTTKNVAVSGTANLTTGVLTATAALVAAHWLEAFDANGNSIGYVPVFASRT
jgi:hypothetical protein